MGSRTPDATTLGYNLVENLPVTKAKVLNGAREEAACFNNRTHSQYRWARKVFSSLVQTVVWYRVHVVLFWNFDDSILILAVILTIIIIYWWVLLSSVPYGGGDYFPYFYSFFKLLLGPYDSLYDQSIKLFSKGLKN
eukprot:jgi/Psemu1/22825/gm1.22825_g